MYKEFYALKEDPFNVTADPDFFFSSEHHNEAISHLIYGINHRKGIIVVSGEIGTGKTTLCRTLLRRLDHKTKTALILNPRFSDVQLLKIILSDFGIEGKFRNKYELVAALNKYLLHETSQGNNVALIIDEAQNLGIRQLEQIRLLSNIETEKDKLLQIILVGQPELCKKLQLPALRQLNQRVTVRFHLLPLDQQEISGYIHHRLNVAKNTIPANGSRDLYFTDDAIEAIYTHSKGTPRMVNILCDRALLAGFVAESNKINEKIIHQCAKEIT